MIEQRIKFLEPPSAVIIKKRRANQSIMPKTKHQIFKLKDISLPRKPDNYDVDAPKVEPHRINANKPKVFEFKKTETDNEVDPCGLSLLTFGKCSSKGIFFKKPKKGLLKLSVSFVLADSFYRL